VLIVVDTGPLIALSGIGQLELLQKLYEGVLVPSAVHAEMLAGGAHATRFAEYKRAAWLEVAGGVHLEPSLLALLGEGEASVIALARFRNADAVLIDEQKARKVARAVYGLRVFGSVRVLLEAKQKGFLESVEDALRGMQRNGYYLHETIVRYALEEAGEGF